MINFLVFAGIFGISFWSAAAIFLQKFFHLRQRNLLSAASCWKHTFLKIAFKSISKIFAQIGNYFLFFNFFLLLKRTSKIFNKNFSHFRENILARNLFENFVAWKWLWKIIQIFFGSQQLHSCSILCILWGNLASGDSNRQ